MAGQVVLSHRIEVRVLGGEQKTKIGLAFGKQDVIFTL
jgi:hypothetical protein